MNIFYQEIPPMKKKIFIALFCLSVLMNLAVVGMFIVKNPMRLNGQQSWIDMYSENSDATTKFLNETLGIKVTAAVNKNGIDYRVIKAKDGLFPYAGVMQITNKFRAEGLTPGSTIYLTVTDYESMHKTFISKGAVAKMDHITEANMLFGIYVIPGGLDVGLVQYK